MNAGETNTGRKKVLVVDGSQAECSYIENILRKEDYEVFTALNSQEALNIFNKHEPNACVLEIFLPSSGINGLELLKKIKERDRTAGCIILTSVDNMTNREAARMFGADAYFVKPADTEVILETIKIALHAQEKLRALEKLGNVKKGQG